MVAYVQQSALFNIPVPVTVDIQEVSLNYEN
jgi:hypothetical protein